MSILQRLIAAVLAIAAVFAVTLYQLSGREAMYQASTPPKEIIAKFSEMAFAQGNVESAAKQYVSPDVIEHDGSGQSGYEGLVAQLQAAESTTVEKILPDGNTVTVIHTTTSGAPVVHIYRLADGFIVEHWDFLQTAQ